MDKSDMKMEITEDESCSKKRTTMGFAKVVLKKIFKPEFFSTKKLNHSTNFSVNDVLSESDDVSKFYDIQHSGWKELGASIGGPIESFGEYQWPSVQW